MVPAQQHRPAQGIDFADVDLEQFMYLVHEQLGVGFQFTRGKSANQLGLKDKKVNIMVPPDTEITDELLFALFLSSLSEHGLTIVPISIPTEKPVIYKFIDLKKRPQPSNVIGQGDLEDIEKVERQDEMMTFVYTFKHIPADQAKNNLSQLIADPKRLVNVPGTNSMIITDFKSSIRRLAQIFKLMDVPLPVAKLHVKHLEHADAAEIKGMLTILLKQKELQRNTNVKGVKKHTLTVEADRRTNSLLILADDIDLKDIEKLVDELDRKLEHTRQTIHYYPLKNLTADDADELADTLSSIFNQDYVKAAKQNVEEGQAGRPVRPTPRPSIFSSANRRNDEQTSVPVITFYKPTNALIISAEPEIYREIEGLVERLDVRKAQVRLHAYIFQISQDASFDFGFELAATPDIQNSSGTHVAGGTQFGLTQTAVDAGSGTITRLPEVGVSGVTAFVFQDSATRIPLLLRASQRNGDINLVSQPFATANDNTTATLSVTNVEPTATTTLTDGGNQVTTVGDNATATTSLEIKPLISGDTTNERSHLTLEIKVTIENFGQRLSNDLPPTKVTREYTGTVVIPDGEAVVIGGLTSDTVRETINKVPLLGDIPIIRHLFRRTTREKGKNNLVIFIQAKILDDMNFEDLKQLTGEERDNLQNLGTKEEFLHPLQHAPADDPASAADDPDDASSLSAPHASREKSPKRRNSRMLRRRKAYNE